MRGVWTVPAGTAFADAIAAGVLDRHGQAGEALADVAILVPTRRAVRALEEGFLRQSGGRPLVLPSIRPIGDVDEDELTAVFAGESEAQGEIAPAIAPLRRLLLLARDIRERQPGGRRPGDGEALRLAAALAAFIDEADTAEADMERLATLVEGEQAAHWQRTLDVLSGLVAGWRRRLAEEGRSDPAARRGQLLDRLAALWRRRPPPGPVIAAGSTGTVPATARLMAAILRLPQGQVVLPGLDLAMDDAAWEKVGPTHPQHALKALLEGLEVARAEVAPWPFPAAAHLPRGSEARRLLLSQALLPPQAEAPGNGHGALPRGALDGLELLACAHPREEAQTAALRMRLELETPGRTVALVTRDRRLARRVRAALRRWSIEVDDSAGEALAATPAGTFFRLAAEACAQGFAPVPLLALLKHPSCRLGRRAGAMRRLARRLERACLRGPRPAPGIAGVRAALADAFRRRQRPVPEPLAALLGEIEAATAPLWRLLQARRAPLRDLVRAHAACLEALTRLPGGRRAAIWAGDDGEALHGFVCELLEDAGALGEVEGAAWPALLASLLAGRAVRPRFGRHPRAFVWGPLEARLQHADCVLLAGLVEGSWPPEAAADPWLSRPMREAFGLMGPEMRIGQAAHDFVQLAAAERVVLLHCRRAGGAPAAEARWLLRLEALLERHGLAETPARAGAAIGSWQARLDRPAKVAPAPPPCPRPPREARPDRLSVTQVELWLRDPYAIYARHILGLRPLDEIDPDADAGMRGSLVHEALARFVAEHPARLPQDALERLVAIGREVFAPLMDRPAVATFWWRRFERIAAWFVERERERRDGIAAVAAEVEGTLADVGGRPFTLTARADRLERLADGSVAVIDYKTGTVPSNKDVLSGKAPQLPLEAAMIREGAFAGFEAAPVAALQYWKLSGGSPAGEARSLDENRAGEATAKAWAGLQGLIDAFADPDTPYRDHPAGAPVIAFDAYADLARTDEWRLGFPAELGDRPGAEAPAAAPPQNAAGNPKQQEFSDPARSVWVTASAGTGKTKVLTDRVLRLLLAGCEPARILCLTFTRAAAAEMATRIRRQLAGWTTCGDADLARRLAALTGARPTPADRRRARQLFALVLDAPGGLRIATIHSFCQSLLGRFPIEAGVVPGFTLIEERAQADLLRNARDRVIGEIAAGRRPDLDEALERLIVEASEGRADILMGEIGAATADLERMLERHGSLAGALEALAAGLGVDPAWTPESLAADACRDGAFDAAALRDAATALRDGSGGDRDRAERIEAFLAAPQAGRPALLDGYAGAFLTQAGSVRKKLCTGGVLAAAPATGATLGREAQRLAAHFERRRALATFTRTRTILTVGEAILAAFRALKRERAVLDYDDLIAHARRLLTEDGMASWVLYKLDGGIDHILVDEAQDTSPFQWQAIRALADEFFAGEGARQERRTLFVVGDEKQSIFSFQGADRDELEAVKAALAGRVAPEQWHEGPLDRSYRSVPAVLTFVDAVFKQDRAKAGVAFGDESIHHLPHRRGDGGEVEVWPLLEKEQGGEPDPWTAWRDEQRPQSAADRMAEAIALRIAAMTGADGGPGETLASQGRPVRAGDVLVLLRRRGALLPALLRALRQRRVAVAGADRMDLAGETAVRDLLALARFCLLPSDDLALAAVLKGPLIGLDEERLFALAWPRPQDAASLWARLRQRGERCPACARAAGWLRDCLAGTDRAPPFAFFEAVLTGPAAVSGEGAAASGRKALAARLGPEALDAIDEFLDLALAYEEEQPPSLQGFVHWFAGGRAEAKREAATAGEAVRIMTVHGAKGLEAPVVFVADDLHRRPHGSSILWDRDADLPLWTAAGTDADAWSLRLKEERRARRDDEERRLLYVALTRARDRLYVAASAGHEGSWHDLAMQGLADCAGVECFDFAAAQKAMAAGGGAEASDAAAMPGSWPGTALRLTCPQTTPLPERAAAREPRPAPPLPAAATRPLAPEPSPPRPLAPSRPAATAPPRSPLAPADGEARRRGRLVHRLLELLPALPAAARREAGEALAGRHDPAMEAPARRALVESVLAIIGGFAPLFAPGSRAEVALAGEVGGRAVAGRVDRLAVTADTVVLVEYKSGFDAPAGAARTPAAHLAQLAAYRALLAGIYPGRRIVCHLLWTDAPRLVEIPAPLLDAHAAGG